MESELSQHDHITPTSASRLYFKFSYEHESTLTDNYTLSTFTRQMY